MWKVAGVLSLLTGIVCVGGVVAVAAYPGATAFCIVMSVLAVIFLGLGICMVRIKVRKLTPQEKEAAQRTLVCEHIGGLPLAQFAACTVSFEDDCIAIHSSGNAFNLSYDKITAMDLRTSTEIQKAYVSSAGGAIAGGVLFGPLGAMVGGRVKEKKSTTVENFIIFTYLKDGNIDYLSFKVQVASKAMKLIQQYNPCIARQGIVTEL